MAFARSGESDGSSQWMARFKFVRKNKTGFIHRRTSWLCGGENIILHTLSQSLSDWNLPGQRARTENASEWRRCRHPPLNSHQKQSTFLQRIPKETNCTYLQDLNVRSCEEVWLAEKRGSWEVGGLKGWDCWYCTVNHL